MTQARPVTLPGGLTLPSQLVLKARCHMVTILGPPSPAGLG